jgi:hypothetical protein
MILTAPHARTHRRTGRGLRFLFVKTLRRPYHPERECDSPGRWSAERPPPGEPRGGFETGLRGHLGGGIPVDPEQNTDHDEIGVGTCQGNDQGDEGILRHDISPFPIVRLCQRDGSEREALWDIVVAEKVGNAPIGPFFWILRSASGPEASH